ncbi:hypothetical protein Taro_016843 [Colocasia esculenta]|uniref:PB1 domain-containing protein n=1 Tax=Colocasia esculenta TaxID=4460 RepID=A0A843UPM3_COLES|nr:hypothetical protein [Colocasia esculenta]
MSGSSCAGEGREDGGLHCEKQQRDGESNVYTELWNACAGPLVSIPRVGEKVYYFPQGHIEQVEASTDQGPGPPTPTYDLPWKILCRVVNVQLKAEHSTDEVFAQLALQPEIGQEGADAGKEVFHSSNPRPKLPSFSKILTASDTSTHGGFSVLKRHADECLPSLDMSQRPPMQDLMAKDLHDTVWCFRHVFRGKNGELRIGVRRALRNQNIGSATVMSSQSMKIGLLAAAFHAISTGTMFTVYYWPRQVISIFHRNLMRSPSEFVVPYDHYLESIRNSYMTGTRFHMKFENEDGLEERSAGTIVGIEDVDPKRWPTSKWRCLKVQWDESPSLTQAERVSPWKIELFEKSLPDTSLQSLTKRCRSINFPFKMQQQPSAENDGSLNDSVNNRVLQGQDNAASESKFNKKRTKQKRTSQTVPLIWKHQLYPDDERRTSVDSQEQFEPETENWSNHPWHEPASHWSLCSNNIAPPTGSRITDADLGVTWIPIYPPSDASQFYPDIHCFYKQKISMEQPAGGMCKVFGVNLVGNLKSPMFAPDELLSSTEMFPAAAPKPANDDHDQIRQPSKRLSSSSGSESLTGQSHSCRAVTARTGIKVHKQGTALGRSMDLSRFDAYEALVLELDRMFDFQGSLAEHSKGWHIICLDKDQEVIASNDYPWKEFCKMVKKIFIYQRGELSELKPETQVINRN